MKFLIVFCPFVLFGLPLDMKLIDGMASCVIESAKMEIAVSDQAILEWGEFGVATNEIVEFIQPNSSSCVLNRVIGQNVSEIFGTLKSNGECILINPNGVVFGKESRIDVYSLIATTFDLHDLNQRQFAGTGGDVFCSGTISAKGHVYLLGERVGLFDNASITVPSGTVLIGGDFQGKNPNIPNADRVYFSKAAAISVSAEDRGDGGMIVLWADTLNQAYGSLFSRGGSLEGDGGIVEVSCHNMLDFSGKIDLLAPFGSAGTLLLDPLDLTIDPAAGADSNVSVSSPFIPSGNVCAIPGPGNSILTTATISGALTGGNVVLQTTGTVGGCPGDIVWLEDVALFSYAETNSLTFDAENDVIINTDIENTLAGDIIFNAGGGVFLFSNNRPATLTTVGNIDVTCGTAFTAAGGIADPSDAGLSAGGTLSIAIANGNLSLTGGSTAIAPASTTAFLTSIGPITIDIASGNLLLTGGTAPGPTANSSATITSLGSTIDINLLNGNATLQTGPGSPANVTITTNAGSLTMNVMNGNVLVDSVTNNANNSSLIGSPLLVSAPQGSFAVIADDSGTTGIGFSGDSYMNISARDTVTFFSGPVGARNQNGGNSPSGFPSLIESLSGDIILQNTGGQRLYFTTNFPLTFRAGRDFLYETLALGDNRMITGLFPLTIEAGRDITIRYVSTLYFASGLTATAGRDILFQQNALGTMIFGADGMYWTAGGSFTMLQNSNAAAFIVTSGGPVSVIAGGNANFNVNTPFDLTYNSAADFSINAGTNINYQSFSSGLVQTHGSTGFTMQSAANINLLDNAQITTDGTSMLFIADINMTMSPTSLIDMVMPLVPASTVTIVVDNAFPVSPLIGPGSFRMYNGAQIMTIERPSIAIYTAQQSLNFIAGMINGSIFTPGTLFVDTDSEGWCVYYPDGFNVVPFRVHYKNCLQEIALQADLIIGGNFLTALHPYGEFPGWWERYKMVFEDGRAEPFFITHRNLRVINNPKSYTAWIHDDFESFP